MCVPFVMDGARGEALVRSQRLPTAALNGAETHALFSGVRATAAGQAHEALRRIAASVDFAPHEARLRAALRETLCEQGAAEAFATPARRIGVYWALHAPEPVTRVRHILGSFVETDAKRIENLAMRCAEDGVDTFLLCTATIALAKALCG